MRHGRALPHAKQLPNAPLSCWASAEGLLVGGSTTTPACVVQLSAGAQHGGALAAAGVRQLGQQPGQLLCAAPGAGDAPFTALYQHGASLRLCTLPASGEPQLLAEFEHEGFAELDATACQVLPGAAPTIVLLQPEPWGLLVLQPAAVPSPAWQSLDLQLPAEHLLATVAHTFHSVHSQLLSMCNNSGSSCSLAAAAPWQLLYSQCRLEEEAGSLQLLLALPVAGAGGQKQQAVLLLMLHVDTMHSAAVSAADAQAASMSVVWCHALDWTAPQSCAVVFERADSQRQQLVAVGSQSGDVHILGSSSKVSSTAQLGGAVHSILHLPRAVVAGSSQHDVLAVLHDQPPASTSSRSSKRQGCMAVSLLTQQEDGGQLQELAVVQGVQGLCAPPAQAPLGLLCPQQPALQQQQQSFAARADGGAVQLAAVIVLDSSTGDTQDSQWTGAASAGLGQHAWLGPGQADGLPGPLLGILAAQAAGSAPASDTAAVAGDVPEQAVGSSNELSGLRSMLAVLEQRWQQETRELYGLQQRVTAAQRLAAAGHKMLCQRAADTLHCSGMRQYVLPLSSMRPGAALAVYHAGRQLAEQQHQQQQEQQQEQAPPQGGSQPGPTQLLLQVVSISTALQDRQLQLQVCVRPELRALNKQLATWSGALLQPCHAELLMWHASQAGVTSSSEWSWDALSGQLTITCSIAVDLLLQLHSLDRSTPGAAQSGYSNSKQAAAGTAGSQHPAAGQAQLAHVLAAAAEQVAGGVHESSSRANSGQQVAQGTEDIQLQAAVALSAHCSNQAVAQYEARQPSQQQHAQLVLQRAQLLAPALALLHLQPFQFAAQDLLMHQLTGSTSPDADRLVSAHPAAAAGANAGAHVTAQTPVKASKQAGAAEHSRRSSMGLTAGASEVVPPTPCSADDGELGVIPDSQEGQEDDSEQQQEPHERRQQLQQWWQSQQQRQQSSGLSGPERANGAAAAAPGAESMDWEAAQDGDRGDALSAHAGLLPAAGSSKQLMLQSTHVDLQLLPTALLRMQCFQTVQEGSQRTRLVLQTGRSAHAPVLQAHAGPIGSGGGVLDFVSLGPHQLHVTVSAAGQHSLRCLEQLLLLAVRQLPGDVAVQASCLDPSVLGRLAAATQTLADATNLHVKVIEDILQQLPATMTRPGQHSAAGTASAADSSHHTRQEPSAQLVVDGSPVSAEASQCWLSCLKAQADVDLAVVRLQ